MRPGPILAFMCAGAALLVFSARAEKAETYDQARRLAAVSGKPILLEFNHDDCPHCHQASAEFDSVPAISQALDGVVFLSLGVLQGEGTSLAQKYAIGNSFPVFILADSTGSVYSRWTGYTGAERFLITLRQGLKEPITIEKREALCRETPTSADLEFLAGYFTDSRDYARALDYCRHLQRLEKGVNLGFRVFKIAAEGAWSDQLPFDSALTAADEMLAYPQGNKYYYGEMAQMMAAVARRAGRTDEIEKYLMAGIEATAQNTKKAGVDLHRDLLADYALHSLNDTTEALRVKKLALGDGWQADPARYFHFGDWCLRRKINLEEAERYVRMATDKTVGDQMRASHLRVLAELCYVRGRVDEAIRLANESLGLDPSAVWFEKKLAEWRAGR